jgi:hypothetical protein
MNELIHPYYLNYFLNKHKELIYIKEQRFHHTQYIYIINTVELNSGKHVSVTHGHLQPLVDTFFILKQSYMRLVII